MARRWYIVLAGLLLTAGLTWTAYQSTPPEYQARGLVLLLPGANAVPAGGNPFLALSGLEQPASIVVAYFASAAAQAEVADVSASADFAVQLDASTRGPVIAIDVTDDTADGAIATLDFLTQRVPEELARLQGELGAPADSIITSMPLVVDDEPETDNSGTIRITIAALALGIVVTGIATFTLDGMLMRRRTRRKARAASFTAEDSFAGVGTDHDGTPKSAAPLVPEETAPAEETALADDPLLADLADEEFVTVSDGQETPDGDGTSSSNAVAEDDETDDAATATPGISRSARHRASDPDAESPDADSPRVGARAGRHR
ncbi:hypothetical protein [Microbacterium timonense]|uniref:hypothetical protein n=1 Tax=Microbacterium timonense TaxID=2086576 RepID=UPI000D0E85C1|nr:hypothetical protein [Microbacterium timonense]